MLRSLLTFVTGRVRGSGQRAKSVRTEFGRERHDLRLQALLVARQHFSLFGCGLH